MKVVGIIPARYGSSRLPGKPLADILDKPMIQWVYEQALKALDSVWVATDDKRIVDAVEAFGGKALMTGNHPNGTSRCLDVLNQLDRQGLNFDAVVNIQGDEPFIDPSVISVLAETISKDHDAATLAVVVKDNATLLGESNVFVTRNVKNDALYFSRRPIPVIRDYDQVTWLKHHDYLKHIGLYAFKREALKVYVSLAPTPLEEAEQLEQLRWLENGYSMHVSIVEDEGLSVDTPDDLLHARELAAMRQR
jgi:3-deoxy-manno-octulosonate cytidylyltransferase (CMP-KDO synthetase)